MDELNTAVFVDRKETIQTASQPRLVDASKTDITPTEETTSDFIGHIETAKEIKSRLDSEIKVSIQEPSSLVGEALVSAETAEEAQIPTSAPVEKGDSFIPTSTEPDSSLMPAPAELLETQPPAQEDVTRNNGESKVENGNTSADEVLPPTKENHEQERAVDKESTAKESSSVGSDLFLTDNGNFGQSEEEKTVSEYCPGLAIRSLALEDILEKRTDMLSELETSDMMSQATSSLYSANPCRSMANGQNSLLHSDSALPRKPLFDPIEVERKFTIAADTEDRLKSLGAKLYREKTFSDVYYDNDDYSLILSDCWLRCRNNTWEAKVPVQSHNNQNVFASATQYREISDEREISRWLVDHLKMDSWMSGDPVDLLVQAAGLTDFARFTTMRRTYSLPSCVVDLDITDHGFRVGEIEVMAASHEEVPHALQTITDMALQLGLTPLILA